MGLALVVAENSVVAQTVVPVTNWRIERATLDREFADRLQEIGLWCRENNLPQQIPETLNLLCPHDLQRQYIFLPSENSLPVPPVGTLGEWLAKINAIKVWQGERIFELAKRAATAEAGGTAFQLLNEVLYWNNDQAEVRKILGHQKTDEGWRVAPDRITCHTSTRAHDLCKWPAESFLVVTSTHFEIESNASEAQTRYLAEKLERWHDVWRQVFFDYWCSPKNLQRWIAGTSSYRHSRKRFRVVFFQNRDHYLAELAPTVRGVEASTGFYNSDQTVSFFYDDADQSVEDTWRHELTHQLFRESIGTGDRLFEEEYIWLDEGIATYFESLADLGDYITIGGFESRRMQFARTRLLLEGFYVKLDELSALGRVDLQSRPDMVRLYSQIAGQMDMLMNDQDGALEPKLIEFLQQVYKGRKIRPGTFEALMGLTYPELDRRYREYLRVDPDRVANHLSLPLTRTELSLAGSQLNDRGYTAIGQCHNLNWLDLSQNRLSSTQLVKLKDCQKITQLFLTECQLEPGALQILGQFALLNEIDLRGSSVTDRQLLELQSLKSLNSLRLDSTRVTPDGIARLKQLLPRLDVTQ